MGKWNWHTSNLFSWVQLFSLWCQTGTSSHCMRVTVLTRLLSKSVVLQGINSHCQILWWETLYIAELTCNCTLRKISSGRIPFQKLPQSELTAKIRNKNHNEMIYFKFSEFLFFKRTKQSWREFDGVQVSGDWKIESCRQLVKNKRKSVYVHKQGFKSCKWSCASDWTACTSHVCSLLLQITCTVTAPSCSFYESQRQDFLTLTVSSSYQISRLITRGLWVQQNKW